jgi:hypothetical protein
LYVAARGCHLAILESPALENHEVPVTRSNQTFNRIAVDYICFFDSFHNGICCEPYGSQGKEGGVISQSKGRIEDAREWGRCGLIVKALGVRSL